MCGYERCLESIEVITVDGSDLLCPEFDFCLELVTPGHEVCWIWLELDKGGLGCEANVDKVGHDRVVRPDAGLLQEVNEFRGSWIRHVGSTM